MTQIERIAAMEERLDRSAAAVEALEQALEGYLAVRQDLEILAEYMNSGLWLRDYTDDAFGRIPQDMKRGVLSQDALYDLLFRDHRLKQALEELCKP